MKATIIMCGLFFFILARYTVHGQCLQNGDFAEYCGQNELLSCETFTCVNNWSRSHGTPQIFVPGPQAINNYAYMWGAAGGGEGIFANYGFSVNNIYQLKIRLSAIASTNEQIFLYAANNMVMPPLSYSCGEPIPNISSKQLIAQIDEFNQGWKEYTISFTPTASYTQIWIYPTSTASAQVHLYVDYIFICPDPCNGTIIYNNGNIPVGETKASYIYAGSSAGSGGSGTVTVTSNQTTNLIAANEIQLLPEFAATVSTGEFIAKIVQPCNPNPNTRLSMSADNSLEREEIDVSRFPRTDSTKMVESKINERRNEIAGFAVYPNPSKGQVTIQMNSGVGLVTINVYDVAGRIVLKKENIYRNSPINLDLSGYKTGYYFIKVVTKNSIQTGKIFLEQ